MAVVGSVPQDPAEVHGEAGAQRGDLAQFREVFYSCLGAQADAQFELTDGAPRGAGVPDGGERPPIFPSS